MIVSTEYSKPFVRFFFCKGPGEASFLLMASAAASFFSRTRRRWKLMKFHMIHAWRRKTATRQLILKHQKQTTDAKQTAEDNKTQLNNNNNNTERSDNNNNQSTGTIRSTVTHYSDSDMRHNTQEALIWT